MVCIIFQTPTKAVATDVDVATDLHQAAASAGVFDGGVCGKGSCGLCRVEVLSGGEHLSPPTDAERAHLGTMMHLTAKRLTCQVHALGDVTLRIDR